MDIRKRLPVAVLQDKGPTLNVSANIFN